jgi:hypothetical protein
VCVSQFSIVLRDKESNYGVYSSPKEIEGYIGAINQRTEPL